MNSQQIESLCRMLLLLDFVVLGLGAWLSYRCWVHYGWTGGVISIYISYRVAKWVLVKFNYFAEAEPSDWQQILEQSDCAAHDDRSDYHLKGR